ncbi:MAG: class I SAM-dependent methyltransferase [Pseudomonadota bacterium]
MTQTDLEAVREGTQDVYDRHAKFWQRERPKDLYERVWIDRFLESIVPKSRLLDLGCGTGDPIARYLCDQSYEVVGVDYSPSMIEIAKGLLPAANWLVADMTALPEIGTFDGILSWDGFFHLSQDQQRKALPMLVDRLRPGGNLMLTIGPTAGEVTGMVGEEPVYHSSLDSEEYRALLSSGCFETLEIVTGTMEAETRGRSVLLAQGCMKRRR